MRLVCPNCDAQYEVGDDAIPAGGRDVQCSNCGHAWFQLSPEVEAAMTAEAELFDPPEAMAEPAPKARPVPSASPAQAPAPAPAQAPRRSLDESVLNVLREEAEHEAMVRRSERPRPLETQPELGLDAAPATPAPMVPAISPTARRIAQLKGIDLAPPPPQVIVGPARPAARRELLPDIEEINSSLRASSDRRQGMIDDLPGPDDSGGRSGFRSGFVLMMVIAVAAVAAYVMAPKIVQQIPASADAMAAYVTAVDHARLWLDGLMRQAITALQGIGGPKG
ncbi:MAG: zinc-ribbon domain-containing protein [Pseudorhodobacter sp.]|nr:zinc-ribbon domain-containing protein [Pseudorhodobacter sp.]